MHNRISSALSIAVVEKCLYSKFIRSVVGQIDLELLEEHK